MNMDAWYPLLKRGETTSLNIIKFYFILIATSTVFLGLLVNFCEKYMPGVVSKSFRWGKHAYKGTSSVPVFEVPKSSFKQFYELGLICIAVTYIFVFSTYILGFGVPSFISELLYVIKGKDTHISNVSATKVFIAVTLLALQIARRFYDTHFVSIFGKNSKINWMHWGVGMTYYPMVILAILSEAPNFITPELQPAQLYELDICDIFGISLFMWSWWHQHVCTVILASLRKTEKDNTDTYKLPNGDWFQYVSSPHYNAEILIYVALTFFLWQNVTWWYVMLWIFSIQIESILLSHWWYQETFKNFPKDRKALIPYIY